MQVEKAVVVCCDIQHHSETSRVPVTDGLEHHRVSQRKLTKRVTVIRFACIALCAMTAVVIYKLYSPQTSIVMAVNEMKDKLMNLNSNISGFNNLSEIGTAAQKQQNLLNHFSTQSPKLDKLSNTSQHQSYTTQRLPFLEETLPTIHFNFKFEDRKVSFERKTKNTTRQIKPTSSTPSVLPPSISKPEVPDGVEKRYLVYICDGHGLCGGIGDRQRTITSFFLLARLSNRQFYMVMSSPCNFDNFYTPRNYQWQPNMTELEPPNNKNTLSFLTFCKVGDEFVKQLSEGDFNQKYPQKVLYFRTNYDISEPLVINPFYSSLTDQWNGLRDKRDRFHWAWHELMQPSPKLMTHLEHVVGSKFLGRKGLMSPSQVKTSEIKPLFDVGDSKLICAHVRMGGNPSIPMDGHYVRVRLSEIPTLLKFMQSKDTEGDAMFFVATDYINIRIRSRNKFGKRFIDYGGKIFHIDRQRSGNDVCEGFGDAALDQLILSLCDVLVVCHSGYSFGAYYTSNSTGHGYYVENDEVFPFEGM